MVIGAGHFLQEQRHVDDAKSYCHARIRTTPKSASRIMIGFCRAPLVAGKGAGGDVVDASALERRLEAVLPAEDRRQNRNVLRRQGACQVERGGVLAEIDKLRATRLSRTMSCALF